MTGAETTDFYGYDRFVLVRPRVCLACGHGFEAQPSRAGCYLMVGVAAVGALIGVGFIALGPLMLRDALLDATATAVERFKLALGGVGACGVGAVWVWRCWKTAHRYWLLKDKA
jgi:hypothetical protein